VDAGAEVDAGAGAVDVEEEAVVEEVEEAAGVEVPKSGFPVLQFSEIPPIYA